MYFFCVPLFPIILKMRNLTQTLGPVRRAPPRRQRPPPARPPASRRRRVRPDKCWSVTTMLEIGLWLWLWLNVGRGSQKNIVVRNLYSEWFDSKWSPWKYKWTLCWIHLFVLYLYVLLYFKQILTLLQFFRFSLPTTFVDPAKFSVGYDRATPRRAAVVCARPRCGGYRRHWSWTASGAAIMPRQTARRFILLSNSRSRIRRTFANCCPPFNSLMVMCMSSGEE